MPPPIVTAVQNVATDLVGQWRYAVTVAQVARDHSSPPVNAPTDQMIRMSPLTALSLGQVPFTVNPGLQLMASTPPSSLEPSSGSSAPGDAGGGGRPRTRPEVAILLDVARFGNLADLDAYHRLMTAATMPDETPTDHIPYRGDSHWSAAQVREAANRLLRTELRTDVLRSRATNNPRLLFALSELTLMLHHEGAANALATMNLYHYLDGELPLRTRHALGVAGLLGNSEFFEIARQQFTSVANKFSDRPEAQKVALILHCLTNPLLDTKTNYLAYEARQAFGHTPPWQPLHSTEGVEMPSAEDNERLIAQLARFDPTQISSLGERIRQSPDVAATILGLFRLSEVDIRQRDAIHERELSVLRELIRNRWSDRNSEVAQSVYARAEELMERDAQRNRQIAGSRTFVSPSDPRRSGWVTRIHRTESGQADLRHAPRLTLGSRHEVDARQLSNRYADLSLLVDQRDQARAEASRAAQAAQTTSSSTPTPPPSPNPMGGGRSEDPTGRGSSLINELLPRPFDFDPLESMRHGRPRGF